MPVCAPVAALLDRGVAMPDPRTVHVAPEVDPTRISGDGVVIHPGCRIAGADTAICAGVELGSEAPVTIRDVRLGPGASLAGGYAARSVFMAGASMGSGAHVREGTLLEEQASGAHTVGLKQTILLPYVTLGSLVNFCDCLMSGGTSRREHSEVGSSYIHFNFTPDGDKTTPSLFGDVVHGVLLDRPAIFLGGQGGAVGPVSVGYGSVVAAGSIVRSDVPPGKLVVLGPPPSLTADRAGADYRAVTRLLAKNLRYLGQLAALEAWYRHARAPFFAAQPLGQTLLDGAVEMLALARAERVSRLRTMLAKAPPDNAAAAQARAALEEVCRVLATAVAVPDAPVLEPLVRRAGASLYLDAVHGLDAPSRERIVAWLGGSVDRAWTGVLELLPSLARVRLTPLV
ncbi:MAG: UDP-N-acetylglucosamine pyrophosphorylase [Dermatophilaceae bacterium]